MFRSIEVLWRRPYSIILTGFLLCLTIPLLFFHSGPFQRFQGWLQDRVKPGPAIPEETPSLSEFYDWDTESAFSPVDYDYAKDAPVSELCRSFPTHLLKDIQPVLKSGHGVLHERLPLQLQTASACLDNLIIFSDLEEEFEGHDIMDVIADIPAHLREGEKASRQLASYNTLQAFAANDSLATLNMTNLKGHKTDKFKFLPAISRAWRLRPERRWYVFYEDDTYVFWDNVFRLLSHFDPDLPFYFGAPAPGLSSFPRYNGLVRVRRGRIHPQSRGDAETREGGLGSADWRIFGSKVARAVLE